MAESIDRSFILGGLHAAVERLSFDASRQIQWLDGGRIHPDELALELDQFLPASVANFRAEFSPAVLARLSELDSALSVMSGEENAELWSESGISECASWARVRKLAAEALAERGWPSF